MRRAPLLVVAVGVALSGAAPARAQEPVTVATPRMSVTVRPDSGTLRLTVMPRGDVEPRPAHFPGLLVDGVRQRGYTVQRGERSAVLRTGAVTLTVEPVNPRAIALTWRVADATPHALELQLLSDDETRYYGTGERFNALNQRGYVIPVITDDRYGNKGVGTHKPIPFVLSTQGFGLWLDSWMPSMFDLSGTERFLTRLTVTDSLLRVVLIAGPEPAEILDGFTELTGRPRVPPGWAFGLWKSRDVHHNRDSVLADVERLRRYDIPASVLVLDSPWETGYNTFVVNRTQFGDAEAMFARIAGLGFRLCLWLTPMINVGNVIDMRGIDTVSANFDEAVRRNVLVRDSTGAVALTEWWKGVGGLVDFTDPAAVAWWHGQLSKTKRYGATAFKADDGEGNFVPAARFHDRSNARAMKNRYAILYNESLQRFIDDSLNGDGVLITRTGYTGTQRFPFAWAGDNRGDFSTAEGLPTVILAGQNAAMSGIPMWGSDIAGYAGTPTKEVFIRWTQFGAFSPFMQVHMTSNLGPWDFDAETLEIFRAFTQLRTQLFPYLYDAALESERTGIPIIRPMALAFPADDEAHRYIHQYLFGPDLLVAPIHDFGTHRPVYIPAGGWIDYWSGERVDGPRVIEVEAPLARMPLYVREGAILVRLPEDVETLVPRHDSLSAEVVAIDDRRIVQLWPGRSGAVRGADGIEARLSEAAGRFTLTLTSRERRRIEVRFAHRIPAEVRVRDGSYRQAARGRPAHVVFPAFTGQRTISWTERSGRR